MGFHSSHDSFSGTAGSDIWAEELVVAEPPFMDSNTKQQLNVSNLADLGGKRKFSEQYFALKYSPVCHLTWSAVDWVALPLSPPFLCLNPQNNVYHHPTGPQGDACGLGAIKKLHNPRPQNFNSCR